MPIQAYFENIQRVLIENLEKAQTSLHVAVAWLTDKEIIRTLAQKAGEQVHIQILITDDDINRQTDFEPLRKAGGKVWLVGKGQENALMHNKFCVIDSQIVITGSYNWSRQAQRNYENITITDEQPELASQFITEFEQIKRAFVETDAMAIDFQAIQKRLEILKNTIALQDEEDITFQCAKLQKLLPEDLPADLENIQAILLKIKQKVYTEANNLITAYLHQQTRLATTTDYELFALQLEIKAIEMQVASLQDEVADIEKTIRSFEVRYRQELGELIRRVLEKQKTEAQQQATANPQDETAQEAYEQARQAYEKYHEQQEATKNTRQIDISPEEQKTLKSAYRRASKLCHPDLVGEDDKAEAEQLFIALDLAYKEQDLPIVQRILANLEKGIFKPLSATLTQKDKLHLALARLRRREEDLLAQIFALKGSKTHQTIQQIQDLEAYFADLKEKYQSILDS